MSLHCQQRNGLMQQERSMAIYIGQMQVNCANPNQCCLSTHVRITITTVYSTSVDTVVLLPTCTCFVLIEFTTLRSLGSTACVYKCIRLDTPCYTMFGNFPQRMTCCLEVEYSNCFASIKLFIAFEKHPRKVFGVGE